MFSIQLVFTKCHLSCFTSLDFSQWLSIPERDFEDRIPEDRVDGLNSYLFCASSICLLDVLSLYQFILQ